MPQAAAVDSAWLGSYSPQSLSVQQSGVRWSFPSRVDSPPDTSIMCDSRSRISEWEENSGALLADAFNVRRLLRLGLYYWGFYIAQTDRILDALYISDKEAEIRMSLSVLLAWVMFCQYSRTHRELANGLTVSCNAFRLKSHFRVWHRLAHSRRHFSSLESRLKRKQMSACIQGWQDWGERSARPASKLRRRTSVSRIEKAIRAWKRARTSRYLDDMQAATQMEISGVRRAFFRLKKFAKIRQKIREMCLKRTGRIAADSLAEWRHGSKDRSFSRSKFLSNFSAVFFAYKFAISDLDVEVHVGLHVRAIPAINHAVASHTLRRWLEVAGQQKLERKEQEMGLKQNVFKAWKSHILKEKKLRKTERSLQTWLRTRGKQIKQLTYFSTWNYRFLKRNSLRSNLANFSEKSTSCLIARMIRSWHSTAANEKQLDRKCRRLEKIRKRDVLGAWINVHREVVGEKIRSDIANLYRKKILGSLLIDCFELLVKRGRWNSQLEKRGNLLGMHVRFQRWRRAVNRQKFVGKNRKKLQKKCIKTSFQNWFRLSRAEGLGRLAAITDELRQKQIVLTTFVLNVVIARKDRMDVVLVQEFRKRVFFERLRKYRSMMDVVRLMCERQLEARTMRRWVQYMAVSESLKKIEKIRQKFVLDEIISEIFRFAEIKRDWHDMLCQELQILRLKRAVSDWRLMALELRMAKFRHQRETLKSSKSLKNKIFKALRKEYEFRKKLLFVCHRRNARLARCVFDARRSGWMLAVKQAKTESKIERKKIEVFFTLWQQRIWERMDLLAAFTHVTLLKSRRVFLSWLGVTRNRISTRISVFIIWKIHVNVSKKISNKLTYFVPRIRAKRIESSFRAWLGKVMHRDELRSRVSSFAVSNTQRLLMSALIGFSEHAEEQRKIRRIDNCISARLAVQAADKWIHATVFKMALREVVDRLEVIGKNLSVFRALEKIRISARLERFWEKRSLAVNSKNNQKMRVLSEAALLGWSAAAFNQRTLRERTNKFLKKRFVQKLRLFAKNRKEIDSKIAIADEFCVDVQARHFTDLIAELVAAWRDVTDRESDLRMKGNMLSSIASERALFERMDQWKAALEYRLYEEDLMVNEETLLERMEERTKSNVFTYLVIVFREAQGLQRFADEYRENRLKALTVNGLVESLVLARKRKILENLVNQRIVKENFVLMFTHVYLAVKERLVFKQFAGKHVLEALRVNAKKRKQIAMADVMGRWKIHKDGQGLSPDMRLVSIALAAWFAVTSQSRLTKQYLPAFRLQDESLLSRPTPKLHSVSNSAAVTAAASPEIQPALFSYREMRPKRNT